MDVRATDRRVRVRVAGREVADTRGARVLFETSLPPRYYLPPEDTERDLLIPAERTTACPYKGEASCLSVDPGEGGERVEAAAWRYEEPFPGVAEIRDRVAFHHERSEVELEVG